MSLSRQLCECDIRQTGNLDISAGTDRLLGATWEKSVVTVAQGTITYEHKTLEGEQNNATQYTIQNINCKNKRTAG